MSVVADTLGGTAGGRVPAGGRTGGMAGERAAGTRRRADRRTDGDLRPGGRPVSYGRPRVAASRAPHRRDAQEVGWAGVLVAALSTALVLAGLLGLAQWRAGEMTPDHTAVVQVRGGESLGDVAVRVAPGSDPSQVVERIVDLNALAGSEVHPGQSLVVPVSASD